MWTCTVLFAHRRFMILWCFKIHYAELFEVLSVMWRDNVLLCWVSHAFKVSYWGDWVTGWFFCTQLVTNYKKTPVVSTWYAGTSGWWCGDNFYVSATVEKQCRGHTVFGSVCLWVSSWVCACWKPCQHHITKTNEGNFTKFWSQMSMGS